MRVRAQEALNSTWEELRFTAYAFLYIVEYTCRPIVRAFTKPLYGSVMYQ